MRISILAFLVGCGGAGGNVGPTDPDVQIAGVVCNMNGTTNIDLQVDMQVTLDTSQSVDTIVTVQTPSGTEQTSLNQFFSCDSWSPVDVGTQDVGCRRDPGQPAHQSVTLMHIEDFTGPLATPTPVSVTASVHGVPPNTGVVATDSMASSCF